VGVIVGIIAFVVWCMVLYLAKHVLYSVACGLIAHVFTLGLIMANNLADYADGAFSRVRRLAEGLWDRVDLSDAAGCLGLLWDGLSPLMQAVQLALPMGIWFVIVGVLLWGRDCCRDD